MTPEIRDALLALEVDGELRPQDVLEAARADKHPLHSFFEWDNEAASEKWRLEQARNLIQRYRVEFIGPDQISRSVRGYISVQKPQDQGGERVYKRTETVLTDAMLREQLLESLKRELSALRRKYGHLQEFASVLMEQVSEDQQLVS